MASSLGAITGQDNRLGFPKASKVIAIVVDGLGAQNLKGAAGHAPFLNRKLVSSKPIACGFPSTTATSLTSFATGLWAGQHGLVGYKVEAPDTRLPANLLTGWGENQKPNDWQKHQTVSQRAIQAGVPVFFIGPKAYENSGFTNVIMPEATYLAGKTIDDRIDGAIQTLRDQSGDVLVYLYIPELDQIAHASGSESNKWLAELELVDSAVRRLVASLGKTDAVLLTADHGIVDVQEHSHLYLDEVQIDWSAVSSVGGDPRVNFVYLKDKGAALHFDTLLRQELGDSVSVFSREQAVKLGLYGPQVDEEALERMPDLFLLAVKKVALYHRDFAPAKSLQMIGQHGALSAQELAVPLLGWGRFETI